MIETTTRITDELIEKAKAGDRGSFSKLVRLLMPKISALTYKMTGDKDAALDLAQDTFIAAWEGLAGFEGNAKVENWLYRIATNKTLNYLKREKRKVDDVEPDQFESSATPETVYADNELRRHIVTFMGTLPTEQRLIFELRFYKQMTFDETALTTGKALGTVKTLYREAVKKLRDTAHKKGWYHDLS